MRVITNERYIEYPLEASERPRRLYEYFVTGSHDFPVDMLRYDGCWPASSEDAARMIYDHYVPETRKRRSIKMRSHREPTIARWASFNWSVGTEKLD